MELELAPLLERLIKQLAEESDQATRERLVDGLRPKLKALLARLEWPKPKQSAANLTPEVVERNGSPFEKANALLRESAARSSVAVDTEQTHVGERTGHREVFQRELVPRGHDRDGLWEHPVRLESKVRGHEQLRSEHSFEFALELAHIEPTKLRSVHPETLRIILEVPGRCDADRAVMKLGERTY